MASSRKSSGRAIWTALLRAIMAVMAAIMVGRLTPLEVVERRKSGGGGGGDGGGGCSCRRAACQDHLLMLTLDLVARWWRERGGGA